MGEGCQGRLVVEVAMLYHGYWATLLHVLQTKKIPFPLFGINTVEVLVQLSLLSFEEELQTDSFDSLFTFPSFALSPLHVVIRELKGT